MWLLRLLSGLLFLLPATSFGQLGYHLYGQHAVLPDRVRTINLIHVEFDTTIRVGTHIEAGQVIGRADTPPLVRSVRYGLQLIDSEAAYEAGRYAEAAALLETAAQLEPANPFITYQLARALYQLDDTKPRAYTLYQRLISQLDGAGLPDPATLNVDVWFSEAYWKLGTLYMDNEQWPEAIQSISQALLSASPENYAGTTVKEQMLQYLTECFYHIGNAELCRHYGNLTLQLFPRNAYVRPYLAHLPRPKAAAKPPVRKSVPAPKRP
jgi:hypothetical protein